MHSAHKRWLKRLALFAAFLLLLRAIGLFNYLQLTSYAQFQWPHLSPAELKRQVDLLMMGKQPEIDPYYNISQFRPIIGPKCMDGGNKMAKDAANNPVVLIFVRSAPNRKERRQAIRTSWGLNGPHFGVLFRTLFVMGHQVEGKDCGEELGRENGEFGDLLVGNFVDHYDNATLKTQHALNYAIGPLDCAAVNSSGAGTIIASHLFLLDDDELLLPWNLAAALLEDANLAKADDGDGQRRHLYSGDAVEGVHPARTVFSKWQIALEEYPFDHFPPYIQGNAVLLSKHTVRAFQFAMQYTKPTIWDDVYLGIMARSLGIVVSDQPKIRRYWSQFELAGLIAAHGFSPAEIRAVYFDLKQKQMGG